MMRVNARRVILALLATCASGISGSQERGNDDSYLSPDHADVLKGVKAVAVFASRPTIRGLSEETLRTTAENRLKEAGIPVETVGRVATIPGNPTLGVYVGNAPRLPDRRYAYTVILSFMVTARPEYAPQKRVLGATVWTRVEFGVAETDRIRAALAKELAEFCLDYNTANPKRRGEGACDRVGATPNSLLPVR